MEQPFDDGEESAAINCRPGASSLAIVITRDESPIVDSFFLEIRANLGDAGSAYLGALEVLPVPSVPTVIVGFALAPGAFAYLVTKRAAAGNTARGKINLSTGATHAGPPGVFNNGVYANVVP